MYVLIHAGLDPGFPESKESCVERISNMLDKVNQSCCVYDKEKSKIVLFYSGDIEAKDLIAILKDKLPRYMLPNSVNKLSSLPTTPNGKLDRNKLSKMITEK